VTVVSPYVISESLMQQYQTTTATVPDIIEVTACFRVAVVMPADPDSNDFCIESLFAIIIFP